MADAAISFAVEKLGEALIEKVNFLKGVEDQVRWVKDELERMQCFLKDAAEKQGQDESIRKWIRDVREVAQDSEDVIEIFTLKVDAPKKRDLVRKWAGFPSHVSHLNRVGNDIESIRRRLDEIGKRRQMYQIQNLGMEMESSRSRLEMVQLRRQMASRLQKDKDVVGLNEDANLLLNKAVILDDDKSKGGLSLTAIVGMGGIGKSTLARKIYNHRAVAARFEHRAWVVVSNEFEAEDIIKEIMQQLPLSRDPADKSDDSTSRRKMLKEMRFKHEERLKEVESVKQKLRRQVMLQEMLRQRLQGKRYFIVLDDVWEEAHWETLKTAFPDEKGRASRLLFTSRNQIIPKHHGYVHKMKPLNANKSWKLLLKTALVGRRCPKELEELGREILETCHGLPLAITVAGGLLVNQQQSKSGWDRVLKQIKNYYLESSELGKILELSYHNLPSHLKPCFLCLAFFKEDTIIRVKRLVHIWVALGLIKAAGEETVEETAMSYLDELINRNLILVKGMSIDDQVKYCHVHDLLRELSIWKANEEIGFESLFSENDKGSSSSSSKSASSYKPRHCVVRGIGEKLVWIDSLNQNKHLRSLFLHVNDLYDSHFTIPSYWKSFELLRILDIEGSVLLRLPSEVRALIGIRYLRLRAEGGVLMLPNWLDALKSLEVVDIAGCQGVIIPNVTWRMNSLRHFYIRSHSMFPESMKESSWKNLETLKYVRADDLLFSGPLEGFGLRLDKLGIQLVDRNGETEMPFERILVERAIQVLHLRWDIGVECRMPIPNSLVQLTKLKLHGHMPTCPTADKFPQNITHLKLCQSGMTTDDVMQELGKLPNLLFLTLDDAINRKFIRVSRQGFPRLKVLHLTRLRRLKKMKIRQGGMPELKRLDIHDCPKLQPENLREHFPFAEIIIKSASCGS